MIFLSSLCIGPKNWKSLPHTFSRSLPVVLPAIPSGIVGIITDVFEKTVSLCIQNKMWDINYVI